MLALYTDKEGTPEEKLGIYFDMYDIDRNGALDMKEIKRMITAIKSQVVWDPAIKSTIVLGALSQI